MFLCNFDYKYKKKNTTEYYVMWVVTYKYYSISKKILQNLLWTNGLIITTKGAL